VEITFFFFIPLTALFSVGNWRMALVFLTVAGVSGIRYYISLKALLEEAGLLDLVYHRQATASRRRSSFLHAMRDFQHYAHGRSRGAWYTILTLFALVFLFLAAGALMDGQENVADGFNTPFTYVKEFAYHKQDTLAYPTCEITSDLGDSILQSMADYAFMAGHGYRGSSISQIELDQFFGGLVTDRIDVVERYHRERGISSRVSIKLLTASAGWGKKEFAYVVIRGTENNWGRFVVNGQTLQSRIVSLPVSHTSTPPDLLTDAQLWAPAILMQVLRTVMPLGDVWTPIMAPLIKAIASVESDAVDQISFYRDTVEFTNWIKSQNDYSGVAITGHSLGGGLSIITGAITETLAVALSGPNAKLVRRLPAGY
jgi:lipase ATG15